MDNIVEQPRPGEFTKCIFSCKLVFLLLLHMALQFLRLYSTCSMLLTRFFAFGVQ